MIGDPTERAPETDRDWFAWLIDPLSVAEFERDYFEQRRRTASPKKRRMDGCPARPATEGP